MGNFFAKSLMTLVFLLSCEVVYADEYAHPPEVVSLRSVNYPDRYIQHHAGKVVIAQVNTLESKANSTFRRVPGLAGKGTVSFQSLDKPDFYLRHNSFLLTLQKNDGSSIFFDDASFSEKIRNDLNSSRLARSYASVNYPGYYLRHENYVLRLQKFDSKDLHFNADSSFEIQPGLVATVKTNLATTETFERWIGTAPFCSASANDCQKQGLEYVRSDKSGNGESCTFGTKVLCRGERKRATADTREVWVGTAPACAATARDCTRLGMSYVRSDRYGDGSTCLSGTKVLCQAKLSGSISEWVGTAPFCKATPRDCKRRGLTWVRSDPFGDGKRCSIGTKV